VNGNPTDLYQELRVEIDPSWFGRDSANATLRVAWLPDPSPGPEATNRDSVRWLRTPIRAFYSIHYSESTGMDCGFHCEPNPHVDGLLHYQERADSAESYCYEPMSFDARSPTGLLWEILDVLNERLDGNEGA
jgi:hypothetical protein